MQFSPFSRVLSPAVLPAPRVAGPALPVDFQRRATEAASLLKALANSDRLVLLCQLVRGECTVTELGVLARIEQPSLSQQLGVLRGERLVATRRDGKNVFYRIASPSALAVLETLHGLFCDEEVSVASRKLLPATGGVKRRRKEME